MTENTVQQAMAERNIIKKPFMRNLGASSLFFETSRTISVSIPSEEIIVNMPRKARIKEYLPRNSTSRYRAIMITRRKETNGLRILTTERDKVFFKILLNILIFCLFQLDDV